MIWQFIINGLITGILYSLLAIGIALVYNTTSIFHITAAGIYVFAAYMFFLALILVMYHSSQALSGYHQEAILFH